MRRKKKRVKITITIDRDIFRVLHQEYSELLEKYKQLLVEGKETKKTTMTDLINKYLRQGLRHKISNKTPRKK